MPQRIISGMPSITEMLFALGLADQIVGVTTNCNYPPQAQTKEKVGGFFLNLEKIVSLKPDLIILLASAQQVEIKRFRDFGLNVYTPDPQSVEAVMSTLLELGSLTGSATKAKTLVRQMRQRLAMLTQGLAKQPTKEVLVVVGQRPLIVAGQGNFINDLLQYARAKNVMHSTKIAYPQLSFEKLLALDPEYIIVAGQQPLEPVERWQLLQAVKQDQVLYMNADILSRPGPRLVEAIEQIAEFIHEVEN